VALLVCVLLAIFVLDSPWSWVVLAVGVCIEAAELTFFTRWSRRKRATVGAETLVGRIAVAQTALAPDGQVKLDGELWQARCAGGAGLGDRVVVRSVDGLRLLVERDNEQ
jgi:membrane protein implicated in regulation of membrane protease activity